ncbi:MAG: hypothetical protein K0R25_204 [Rickettsiaceae bacterium]|jgi:hypothetical protein|nr:hypothetical protein [Rickettsiaceae bacterium]
MNGCLFKLLVTITVCTLLFLGYPYFKEFAIDSINGNIDDLKSDGIAVRKFIDSLPNELNKKNDDSKDKKTGQ